MKVTNYWKAPSLQEAYDALQSQPKSAILGGGAWMKLTDSSVETLISLDELHLDTIHDDSTQVHVGCLVTLREFETNPLIQNLGNGVLSKAASQIMGVTLRNIATVGGSVVSRFGFSDLLVALLCFDVTLHFYHHGDISLENYLNDKTIKRDILTSLSISKQSLRAYFKKVATTALDYAILAVGVCNQNGRIRIFVGSRPQIATSAPITLSNLPKAPWSDSQIDAIAKSVSKEIAFGDNFRASKEYREQLCHVYVKRGLKEVLK